MNIKIDTTNKIITIEDSLVSFADLIQELDKLIPNWKEYKLQGVQHSIQYIPNYIPYQNYPAIAYPVADCGTFIVRNDCGDTLTAIN